MLNEKNCNTLANMVKFYVKTALLTFLYSILFFLGIYFYAHGPTCLLSLQGVIGLINYIGIILYPSALITLMILSTCGIFHNSYELLLGLMDLDKDNEKDDNFAYFIDIDK